MPHVSSPVQRVSSARAKPESACPFVSGWAKIYCRLGQLRIPKSLVWDLATAGCAEYDRQLHRPRRFESSEHSPSQQHVRSVLQKGGS